MLLIAAIMAVSIVGCADAASRNTVCLGIDCPRGGAANGQNAGQDGVANTVTVNVFGTVGGDVTVQTNGVQAKGADAGASAVATPSERKAVVETAKPVVTPTPITDDCFACEEEQPSVGEATCEQTRAEFIETFGLFVWVPATRTSGFLPQDDGANIPSAQEMIRNIGELQVCDAGDEIPAKMVGDKVRQYWDGPLVIVTTADSKVTGDQSGQTQKTILVTFAANWRGSSKVIECYQLIINQRGYLDFDLCGAVNVDGYPSVNEITTISAVNAEQMAN